MRDDERCGRSKEVNIPELIGQWSLPEVVGTVQQVHCSWKRLLQRGLKIHVCTINKSAHTKKVWKLI